MNYFRTVCAAGGVLLATVILCTARADNREVLRYSYTPASKGRPGEDALERLRKAAEGVEGPTAMNVLVRIAEVSGDSADYERAFLADTNSVEAVCGLVATKSSRDDLRPWIDRWVSLDPTNALPHYLAAWHAFARSNHVEGFRSLVQGNEQGQAWFRPLYSKLLKERILDSPKPGKEFGGWNPDAWYKSATKLMDMWNWVYRNPDLCNPGNPVAALEELRKASDIFACMRPWDSLMMTTFLDRSQACLEKVMELDARGDPAWLETNRLRIALREWMRALLLERIRQSVPPDEKGEFVPELKPNEVEKMCRDLKF